MKDRKNQNVSNKDEILHTWKVYNKINHNWTDKALANVKQKLCSEISNIYSRDY